MRVQLLSDLHLERYPDFQPLAAPDADLLVLAGDIGSYQAESRLATDDFGLGRFSPRRPGAPWRRVLYLPGNHEYDGLPYDETRERLRGLCGQLGIDWLEQAVLDIDGVRFVGSTLWADFDALAGREKTAANRLRSRQKAFRAANHYLSKNTLLLNGVPALAEDLRPLALAAEQWLRGVLDTPFDGPTVAVTHFAPTLRSADPRYGLAPGTAGFCNDLDPLLARAQVWMHGHLHCPHDYLVEGVDDGRPWACRVVANPRGYARNGEQAAFREGFVVDIPAAG